MRLLADRIPSALAYVALKALTKDLAHFGAERQQLETASRVDRLLVGRGGNVAWGALDAAAVRLGVQAVASEELEEKVRVEVRLVAATTASPVAGEGAGGEHSASDEPGGWGSGDDEDTAESGHASGECSMELSW